MKRAIVFLSFLLIHSLVLAQTPLSSGTLTIGGSVSYASQSFDKVSDNTSVFNFNPKLGYFFIDNLYSAFSISYDYYSLGKASSHAWGVGPVIRYYFGLEKVKPFLGLGFTYYDNFDSGGENKYTTTEIKSSGGIDYFITDYFALEVSLNYSWLNYNLPSGYYLNATDQSKLFQIAVGVNNFVN